MHGKFCARIRAMVTGNASDDISRATEFVVFSIENAAKRLGRSGADVYRALVDCNGIEGFLYPSYDALHTQGKDYIVDETIGWLRDRMPAFVGTST